MAYAAAISLKQTIERRLLDSSSSLQNSLQLLHDEACSLQQFLKQLDSSKTSNINRKRLNALDAQIKDAVIQLEDAVDQSHFSNQETIHSLTQKLNQIKPAYTHELHYPSPEDHEDEDDEEEEDDDNHDSKMVGLSDQYTEIKENLTNNLIEFSVMFVSLCGMAGIGKTALANKLFQDPTISGRVDARAFVVIGQRYRLEDVLLEILKQINPDRFDENRLAMEGAEEKLDALQDMVSDNLEGRSFFIVLDDVWDPELLDQFAGVFPWQGDKSQVLVTTRLQEVAEVAFHDCRHEIRFLDKKESWDLLRWKVFGDQEQSCPSEMEKAGKKIAENCEGLPLTIVKVASILSKAEKTTEYWNRVAADKKSSVFVDAYDRMHNVLYRSYDFLDQHLKPCFLYMGVFPQNHEIHRSNLFNLWIVEGLVLLDSASEVFEQLVSNSLVKVRKQSLVAKTFSLLSPFWHMCNKEATKNKFFHGLDSLADALAEEDLESQRRLCIRNNVLLSITDVRDSIASVSTLRSLLCTGPYHPYPVPICWDLRLLRILHALTLRLYEFPVEVLNLVRLTYLALMFNGDTPVSITKLRDLHYLIVHRHLSIVESYTNISSSRLPMEIWDMKELKHLQVMGSDLPQPHEGLSLPNLLTLLGMSPRSCTSGVLQKLPNLRELGIRIELHPHDHDYEPLCVFDHISRLRKLERLKCIIVNPEIAFKLVSPPVAPLSILPPSLVKLTLSGFGYPWEEMRKLSSLRNLAMLKLRCYAFRGPKWEVGGKEFRKLRCLVIEDSDLVEWSFLDDRVMYKLELLSVRHCYKLERIPLGLGVHLKKIEVIDCKGGAMACAKQLKEHRNKYASDDYPLDLTLHSS